jgi:spore maturation protein CgeB
MPAGLKIAFFGSSLVSAYWNGAATYYRGIVRALHGRGHRVTFYEPNAYGRQEHRDMEDPAWAQVVIYSGDDENAALRAVEDARDADLVVKASGIGVFDELLERAVLELQSLDTMVVFWDVDAPATLERIERNPLDPFRNLIPRYDLVLTYGGGSAVVRAYERLGARTCVPIYNALDPQTHHPTAPSEAFACDLGFLGNRLPDREARVEEFFLEPARRLPGRHFLLGGAGWETKTLPGNVRLAGHVGTEHHNAFFCSGLATLNVNRESMARYGFSPPTRVFEAAGAAACVITDAWAGIETFFEPGKELLIAEGAAAVADVLAALRPAQARQIGRAAYARALAEHTYAHRAKQLASVLERTVSSREAAA